MKLQVTPFHFEEFIKKGYSLDQIYLLKLIENQFDIKLLCEGSMKIAALYQSLIRKGLITENDCLTLIGQTLLNFMQTEETTKLIKRKPANTEFEEWWGAYPGTDTFQHEGRFFKGSRSLRQDKVNCRLKFDKILIEGEHTATQLISALTYDVLQKKENSVKSNTNKLTFMQNSLTYLNQRSYEPFIELIQEGITIMKAPKIAGGTDI